MGEEKKAKEGRRGERRGTAEAKKHIAWYIKGVNGVAAARAAVMTDESSDEILEIISKLQDTV